MIADVAFRVRVKCTLKWVLMSQALCKTIACPATERTAFPVNQFVKAHPQTVNLNSIFRAFNSPIVMMVPEP